MRSHDPRVCAGGRRLDAGEQASRSHQGQAELQAWQAIRALVLADPSRLRETRLSPAAVWEQGKKQLWRIPLDLYVTLLGPERCVP